VRKAKNKSLWDYYMKKSWEPSRGREERTNLETLGMLSDVVQKQYLGFNVGNMGYLELAGPQGPNLSPPAARELTDIHGRRHSKPHVPGFSMKYTMDI
jgi:hypothetical protein